jgi:hypothetical protein
MSVLGIERHEKPRMPCPDPRGKPIRDVTFNAMNRLACRLLLSMELAKRGAKCGGIGKKSVDGKAIARW